MLLATLVPMCSLLLPIGCARKLPAVATTPPTAVAPKPPPPPATRAAVPLPQVPKKELPPTEVRRVSIPFDFDSYMLRPEAGPLLQSLAATARRGDHAVRIEGHCDERGTPEYNLALGDGRARSAQKYLEQLGVPKEKTSMVSFGSQRPKALGHYEAAWAQNRRGEVMIQ